ncbi:uncharacterized protein I303_101751 [Kwoniella dejecticola CBS 10117]|uniref:Structure-specific endonuclease subunit SLX4 n=1 Tax=Kwoniella dejecticola CBS 10117 TaxID=1296121 RepID=A0A1A6ACW8_9TREE|nr:uncharacterized protein I303_02113 [Kwoniella dejecticola CBS 10117]OBR87899.1 hypothetical protein I303_02113 [Kwoniella dejecticola CBS 10117]
MDSVTPKAQLPLSKRPREYSATPTPTAHVVYEVTSSSPESEIEIMDDQWGDEALLSWEGEAGAGFTGVVGQEDDAEIISVSSVAPSEAGLEEADEEDWGRDAYLEWAWDGNDEDLAQEARLVVSDSDVRIDDVDNDQSAEEGESPEEEEGCEENESPTQLVDRGMPDYSTWDLKKLQKLITSYGYRTSTDRASLTKIAVDCWKAMHPLPSPQAQRVNKSSRKKTSADQKASPRNATRASRDSSVSSADVSLAAVRKNKAKKGKSKESALVVRDNQDQASTPKAPSIRGRKAESTVVAGELPKGKVAKTITVEELNKLFYKMIMNDQELWLRILRYEPISFDELISKSIANGIDQKRRSWKKDLKKYLDMKSISFFTEDPTGQRRRH